MDQDTRQHILHVRVVANAGGGPDKTILRSAKYLDSAKYAVTCVYLYPQGSRDIEVLRERAEQEQTQFIAIPERGAFDFAAVNQVKQICLGSLDQYTQTIWHAHDYKSDALGLLMRQWLQPNSQQFYLVTTLHGFTNETWRTRLYAQLDNLAVKSYDRVIPVSPPLAQHCSNLGIADERIVTIPNAIELEHYEFKPNNDTKHERKTLGVVSRLSVEKGVDRAIQVIAKLPGVKLDIVGDGPERANLEQLTEQLNLRDRVTFHGWQTKTRKFFQSFDAVLLPSHTEGLPNVLLEAMALGIPVIATDVGGVRDLLDNGKAGLLLPENEARWPLYVALALRVDKARQMTRAARQRIEHEYTFVKRMERIASVYESLSIETNLQSQAA